VERSVMPLVLAVLGLASLAGAVLLLRSVGPAYRVARLLAATPEVTLTEAIALAGGPARRYVRITGRISSDEEFPDEHDRPLVFRRRRVETEAGARRRILSDVREAVPFGIELRSEYLAVDGEALGDGLVVIVREAFGTGAELPPELRSMVAPEAPVRVLVEQVSAVEHATAAGVPVLGPDGLPLLGPGLGRPLILTTLELPAAMRVLARGKRRVVVAAAALLVCGPAFLAAAVVVAIVAA
jgi:hypothetical protein